MPAPDHAEDGTHHEASAEIVVERFPAATGKFWGILVCVTGAGLVVAGLWQFGASRDAVAALGLVVLALGWASLLRPALWATADELVMRELAYTVRVPLAAISTYDVGSVLSVAVGGKRYTSSVVGRSRKKVNHTAVVPGAERNVTVEKELAYVEWVKLRLGELTKAARNRAGVRERSAEQTELAAGASRTWDPVALVVVVVPVVLLVVALLVN